GSDGDLTGSGADLDVVSTCNPLVVGAPPVGLAAGGPEPELVDGELRHPTPDVDANGHTSWPDQLDVARSAPDPNASRVVGARQPHLNLGGPCGDLQTSELQALEVGHDVGQPHAGPDRPRDPAGQDDIAARGAQAHAVLDGHRASVDLDVRHLALESSAIEVLHGTVHPDGEVGGASREHQLPDVHRTQRGGQLLHGSGSGHLILISSHAMPTCLDATLATLAWCPQGRWSLSFRDAMPHGDAVIRLVGYPSAGESRSPRCWPGELEPLTWTVVPRDPVEDVVGRGHVMYRPTPDDESADGRDDAHPRRNGFHLRLSSGRIAQGRLRPHHADQRSGR